MKQTDQYNFACRILLRLAVCAISLQFVACGWTAKKEPSVLVVAVENLNYEEFPCDQGYVDGGFEDFCLNAIRFTHAYTPSIISQSALSSVLSGMYPIDHGVRHNGNQFLPESVDTTAEVFVRKGYKTSFFTGGPPIFRKSGLAQGFEFFDDQINLGPDKLYRPAAQTTELFLDWIDRDVKSKKFFSLLYLADLQFSDVATMDIDGNLRSRSSESQLRALDDALMDLIKGLKRRQQYDNTIIILVGLNGRYSKSRVEELQNTTLFSENTQVALFIKPNHISRDLGINWKIDNNVSLVDIGHTLFDIAGENYESKNKIFPSVSLKAIFTNPYASWSRDRSILVETAWPAWRGLSNERYSIRKGQFLILFDDEVKVFNSLIDRFENNPINTKDKLRQSILASLTKEVENLENPKWLGINPQLLAKLKISQSIFRKDRNYEEYELDLDQLLLANSSDRDLNAWKTALAFERRNWQVVKENALKAKNSLLTFVAQFHLSEVFKGELKECGVFFRNQLRDIKARHDCRDETFLNLLRWQKANQGEELEYQERFLRSYISNKLSERLTKLNYFANLTWLVGDDLSKTPSITDLYLTLPQSRRQRAIVNQRLKRFFPEIN